jgi:cell wall-associated NlpC family hydrolase
VPAEDSDATSVTVPGYVDLYGAVFRSAQALRALAKEISAQIDLATADLAARQRDLLAARTQRDLARQAADVARLRVDASARDLYIRGAGGFDGVIGVLSSGPRDFLANADSWAYLTSAASADVSSYATHESSVQAAEQAVIEAEQAVAHAEAVIAGLQREYDATMASVQGDDSQLESLVASSQPQIEIGTDGCPTTVLDGVAPAGVDLHALCVRAVLAAPTVQAALAVQWALGRLGAPYACEGIGRLDPFRFDCSSFVSRAYSDGGGIATATDTWAPSTRNMVPWDGKSLDDHYVPVEPDQIRPGDLVLYDTCPSDGSSCPYRHVVMFLGHLTKGGPAYMAHTNKCGGVAHVEEFTGIDDPTFLGVRRVLPSVGEQPQWRLPSEAPTAIIKALQAKAERQAAQKKTEREAAKKRSSR